MIVYSTYEVKMPVFSKRKISAWIKLIASEYKKKVGEIAYIFCSDDKILEINNEYLSHDYFTDVITFDYSYDNIISGDIFISTDTVRTNAIKFNVSYEKELYRVIIHGILHLCGLEDNTKVKQIQMGKNEDTTLNILYTKFLTK